MATRFQSAINSFRRRPLLFTVKVLLVATTAWATLAGCFEPGGPSDVVVALLIYSLAILPDRFGWLVPSMLVGIVSLGTQPIITAGSIDSAFELETIRFTKFTAAGLIFGVCAECVSKLAIWLSQRGSSKATPPELQDGQSCPS